MTEIDDAPAAPALEKVSLLEDFVDIFTAPATVFARRANAGFFLVMVIMTLVLGGLFLANRGVMSGIMDAEIARSMADAAKQNPGVTQEQMATGAKFAGKIATFGAFIGIPVIILLMGLATWITGKIFGAKLSYQAATMIASYAFAPRIIESLTVAVQGLVLDTSGMTGRYQLSLGVGRFLDPNMSRGLQGLLGRIDVFTLWVTALVAIGIVVVGKLPRGKLIPAGAVMWLFGALPALWTLVRG